MWKIDPKDKHLHKSKHDHIQSHILNMFIVELGEVGKVIPTQVVEAGGSRVQRQPELQSEFEDSLFTRPCIKNK
jgi:hypothetical protein